MRPVLGVGWPDEMQARAMLLAEFRKLEGGRAEFCRRTRLSRRYLNLIMEWKRTAAHDRVRGYFGWKAVYVPIEDLDEAKERHQRRVGRRKTVKNQESKHDDQS